MKKIQAKLTFSNVLACLALFVALGGSAYAATQVPKNSVGSRQLKVDAVTTAKIRNGAVTGAKIKASSLGTVPRAKDSTQLGGVPASSYLKAGQAAGGALGGTYPNPTLAAKALVASDDDEAVVTIGSGCTHYSGAEVTIEAPSAGTVVLSADVWLRLMHESGKYASAQVFLSESPTECPLDHGSAGGIALAEGEPSYSAREDTIPASLVAEVAAGTHTYYLNGLSHAEGTETQRFANAGLIAVFYPS